MAFVKLDCGILNSTLWVEREPRDIFITALLMAVPRELLHPMPQYKVGAIEETGFVVPPGWYGFVEAAGPGIVRRSMAEMEPGMIALEKLGNPDPESRSSEFDGRRLVRVDGGYIVLNFMKYRDKDNTAAVRAQRYRDKQKITNVHEATSRRDVNTVTRDSSCGVTKAEAEAEAEAPSLPGLSTNPTERETARKRAAIPAAPGVAPQVWDDWLTLRKAKKAPVTATVIESATKEAAKAGMTLEAFLIVWCRRGSQGLEADWLKPAERQNGSLFPGRPDPHSTVSDNPNIEATQRYLAQQAEAAAKATPPPAAVLALRSRRSEVL